MPPLNSRSTGARSTARISSSAGSRSAVDVQQGTHLRGQRDRLRRPREHPAARRDQLGGGSRPTTSRAARTACCRSAYDAAGSGSGSRKTCRWSNAATSRIRSESSMRVAEHVAGHVPDTDHRELVAAGVQPELAEVPAHRLPCPAGGDAQRLVVVPGGPAGGERVTQPEAVLGGDRVRQVRQRGRALVRGDHQVGVRTVVAAPPAAAAPPSPSTRLSVTSSSPRTKVA